MSESLQSKLALAERHLGRLDIASQLLPNPDRFVYMYVRQEAVLSSQIEGTQASLSDLLEFEAAESKGNETVDIKEVLNYIKALNHGIKLLEGLPISSRMICDVHGVLTRGVRGGEASKTPGKYRTSQNWIGGTSPGNAKFVPPPPYEMRQAVSDLEKYTHSLKPTPLLIEIALAHAQFETIHPFLDGNGRLGRMLITFLLCQRGALALPLLYLSYYLKLHQQEYYDRLQSIRTEGDWEGWIGFFLDGVAMVAEEATTRARNITRLIEHDQALIRKEMGRRSSRALDALDYLVQQPVVSASTLIPILNASQPTVDRILIELNRLGLLEETTGRRRSRRFAYKKFLDLFQVRPQ